MHVHRPAAPSDDVPVVALHGFPQTHRCWDPVVERLVAAGRTVLAPELRGYAPGARPADDEAYALDPVVGDVLAVVAAEGAEQVDLLGHDWGAVAVWGAAAARPDLVRSLVAVSVPHPGAFAHALRRDPRQAVRSAYIALFRRSGRRTACGPSGCCWPTTRGGCARSTTRCPPTSRRRTWRR